MKIIEASQVHQVLQFPNLITALNDGFSRPFSMPPRQVFSLAPEWDTNDALLFYRRGMIR